MPGSLYLVSTPIGNLEDITLRAVRILREVALIAAEDTRHTRNLLNHLEIRTPTTSYHDHSPPGRLESLLARMEAGENVALVTDAGTPGISDPGHELVVGAIRRHIPVIPIPGASAVLGALVVSGMPATPFVFEGFLPRSGAERRRVLERLARETRTVVLFEAPHRLKETLRDLERALGARRVAIAREITKMYEEIWRGSLAEAVVRWHEQPRGEFVLVIEGSREIEANMTLVANRGEVEQMLLEALTEGMSRRDAAGRVARELSLPFREVYRVAIGLITRDNNPSGERQTQD